MKIEGESNTVVDPCRLHVGNGDEAIVPQAAAFAAAPGIVIDAEQRKPNKDQDAVMIDGERLIDLQAVLRRVPVARSTLFERIRDGAFPQGRKFGRRRLWRESIVDAFVRNL